MELSIEWFSDSFNISASSIWSILILGWWVSLNQFLKKIKALTILVLIELLNGSIMRLPVEKADSDAMVAHTSTIYLILQYSTMFTYSMLYISQMCLSFSSKIFSTCCSWVRISSFASTSKCNSLYSSNSSPPLHAS